MTVVVTEFEVIDKAGRTWLVHPQSPGTATKVISPSDSELVSRQQGDSPRTLVPESNSAPSPGSSDCRPWSADTVREQRASQRDARRGTARTTPQIYEGAARKCSNHIAPKLTSKDRFRCADVLG